jgi:hypothetical protein
MVIRGPSIDYFQELRIGISADKEHPQIAELLTMPAGLNWLLHIELWRLFEQRKLRVRHTWHRIHSHLVPT